MSRQSQSRELRSASAAEAATDLLIYAPQGLAEGIRVLADEPVFAEILERAGPPRFRRRRNGFGTLLHIILEQQVSIDAAAAMHRRLVGLCHPLTPKAYLALDDATLRSCGFSRQKMGYARHLAEVVDSGKFDFARLGTAEDEAALAELLSLEELGGGVPKSICSSRLGDRISGPPPISVCSSRSANIWGSARDRTRSRCAVSAKCGGPWRSVATCLFWQSYLHARGRTAPRLPPELYA